MQNNVKNIIAQVAEVQLSYKSKVKASDRPVIRSSFDCYQMLLQIWEDHSLELSESFKVLYLNRANQVLCFYSLSTGGMTGTVADPRLIFMTALKVAACNLILCHNHPSGNLKPSEADIELTRKIVDAGRLLDIRVLDHMIVTAEGYYSFSDEGLIN
jgi:DNA repair protein RadC